MKRSFGFTLLELLIAITIVIIIAFTAAPKFLNLQSDARKATLEATKAAMVSAFDLFALESQIPSSDIVEINGISYMVIDDYHIRINDYYGDYPNRYPLFSPVEFGKEPYGLIALKAIMEIEASDSLGMGDDNFNYIYDTNWGFIIFSKNDDYTNSKCYLQYAPDQQFFYIDDLPDDQGYFHIVTSGC
ncbi:prepilin-type N-terminal cleavage/methylation domain-containing protein [Vibrio owensii]|uniref:prepilin-type N-terminal cleavage/methylation domain-containing protein n=1 Tax=Vibrio owensii TaxID=696485 RepID=UPI0006989D55|nr:prepilin-type N-terminal cleavage/methylation domain-containing protein [Vibrio owensii]